LTGLFFTFLSFLLYGRGIKVVATINKLFDSRGNAWVASILVDSTTNRAELSTENTLTLHSNDSAEPGWCGLAFHPTNHGQVIVAYRLVPRLSEKVNARSTDINRQLLEQKDFRLLRGQSI